MNQKQVSYRKSIFWIRFSKCLAHSKWILNIDEFLFSKNTKTLFFKVSQWFEAASQQSNLILLCKELILIKDRPQSREDFPEPHLNVVNSRSVESITATPLWFLHLYYAWSLLFCLCSFLSLCPALSSRIKHNAFSRGWLLPSPSLACSQTWMSSTTRGLRLTFGGQPQLLHSMGREQGWGHLRANPEFGVFWFIPPLLSKSIFGQPPL